MTILQSQTNVATVRIKNHTLLRASYRKKKVYEFNVRHVRFRQNNIATSSSENLKDSFVPKEIYIYIFKDPVGYETRNKQINSGLDNSFNITRFIIILK